MKRRRVRSSFRFFFRRLRNMLLQPIFIALTVFGNLVIFTSAFIFFHLEYGINPQLNSFIDALWWAVATVSTVGYGDVVPITYPGRILGICTVIVGAALFWSYTALFAEALLTKDISDFEQQLRNFTRTLTALEKSEALEEHQIKTLVMQIKDQLNNKLLSERLNSSIDQM